MNLKLGTLSNFEKSLNESQTQDLSNFEKSINESQTWDLVKF